MTVLSDIDILKRVKRKTPLIKYFNEDNLTPNGYDVTIEEIRNTKYEIRNMRYIILPKSSFFVLSKEYFVMPSDLCGTIYLKTRWIRKGVLASFGVIDAGFRGKLTLGAFNTGDKSIEINVNDKFAQVIFHKLSSKVLKKYAERSGNYQNSKTLRVES